ncbi:anti-adapter protein IraM, partial [Shigella flexneri]|nr:anti-adapter protein IraM [Shigella flexneri]EIN2430769.1 anti-adapter protein IraM [Shigella flexneri]
IILQEKEYPITIYNIAPFNKNLWSLLKSSQECPPGESKITNKCLHNSCIIKICPICY